MRLEQAGTWRFAVVETDLPNQFIAWCAQSDDLGNGPLDIPFDIDVHFEFASSEDEAIRKLKAEVLS